MDETQRAEPDFLTKYQGSAGVKPEERFAGYQGVRCKSRVGPSIFDREDTVAENGDFALNTWRSVSSSVTTAVLTQKCLAASAQSASSAGIADPTNRPLARNTRIRSISFGPKGNSATLSP
jgi:hypothetical protein